MSKDEYSLLHKILVEKYSNLFHENIGFPNYNDFLLYIMKNNNFKAIYDQLCDIKKSTDIISNYIYIYREGYMDCVNNNRKYH